jgi:hypothetical protein
MDLLNDDQKAAVKVVFDNALNGNTTALGTLIDAGGVHPVFILVDLLEYGNKDELMKIAIEYSVKQHVESTRNRKIDYACGCRHPESEHGTADRAFVVAKSDSDITAAMFMDGKDYIGHPKSDSEAKEQYAAHV